MSRWLVKSDPAEYSATHLERDGHTTWDGVSNPLAVKHLKGMAPGDGVFVYHTGAAKAVVALAKVASPARPDPRDKTGKTVTVDLAFDAWLTRPVALSALKSDPTFGDFDLVRMSRLSVMPVPSALWNKLLTLGGGRRTK
ncbi:MAG: EVE domain-containing protein [Phycisphaerales bacterium]|nr:EVE domain-containing protein [Phycisphaerales bacterium]